MKTARIASLAALAWVGLWAVHAPRLVGQTVEAERVTVTVEQTTTTQVTEKVVTRTPPKVRKVAIFVKNRAGAALDEKVAALEDLVVGRITDMGFSVISREDAINAVSSFADAGPNAGDPALEGADLDAILSNSTSALRLGQNLNADYLFMVSITSFGQNKRAFKGYGVETVNLESVLRVSYKLTDLIEGGSLSAGVVKANTMQRFDENAGSDLEVVNDLLDAASVKLADQLQAKLKADAIREGPAGERQYASVTVNCTAQDLNIPDIVKLPDGEYTITENPLRLQIQGATIEVNGVAVGTTPGPVDVPKGLNKLRITREDYEPWERTVSFRDGQQLNIALVMTERGRQKWLENAAIFDTLKRANKITDADIEVLRGYAQMLRQSGYKVDVKSDAKLDAKSDVEIKQDIKADIKKDEKTDIKVDTTEGIQIEQNNQSFWQDVENPGVKVN